MEGKFVTTFDIELILIERFGVRRNIIVPNVSWGINIHECDLFIISQSHYVTEIEIKISLSDLKKDKQKKHGHHDNRIKYLYFAIPEKLEKHIEHIPERAGIFIIREKKNGTILSEEIRRPKKNKNCIKLPSNQVLKVSHLGCMRILSLMGNISSLKKSIKNLRRPNRDKR